MSSNKKPLNIALHGMDSRSVKTMMSFLLGPCQGHAQIISNSEDADIDMFDADSLESKKLLEQHCQTVTEKPIIILSVRDISSDNLLYLKKPVTIDDMQKKLAQARKLISLAKKKALRVDIKAVLSNVEQQDKVKLLQPDNSSIQSASPKSKNFAKKDDYDSKIDLYHFESIPFEQAVESYYNPEYYYQGAVCSAINESKLTNSSLELKSDWKTLTLFPPSKEIWLDASDDELKIFAGIQLKRKTTMTPLRISQSQPSSISEGGALYKFQSMDSFLWKLACWTSNGRYPQDLDYEKPVFLKKWPNFTRLLVTPHALRIAALLIRGPRTMYDIAKTLDIPPQYVHVFISAAYSVGLSGQAKRASDILVQTLGLQKNSKYSLFSQIINKLRGI